jgi:hypothetical protein
VTDANKALHLRRLRQGLEAIPGIREGRDRALDANFQAWKSRTEQSLGVLFGEKHHYAREFSNLNFWLPRMNFSSGPIQWSVRDQERFEDDLVRAEQMLTDALEEVEVFDPPRASNPPQPRAQNQPPVSVTVVNVLSQTTVVDIRQIYGEIDSLRLPSGVEAEAKLKAAELEAEVRGEQRWPVLAKTLDTLKALGKPVYEKVAIPLLLEMLKKQAGL